MTTMETEGRENTSLKLQVVHGPDKYIVELPPTSSTAHLSQELEALTGVPQSGQKIINRGRTLGNSERTLSEMGLKDGSKVMLIGKRFNLEDDENFKLITEVEKKMNSLVKKQAEISEESSGIEKGYLQTELRQESLCRLSKRLGVCHEAYVRLLEQLDSLELGGSTEPIRRKRKMVVVAIQKHLDSNDSIGETISKLQCPDAS